MVCGPAASPGALLRNAEARALPQACWTSSCFSQGPQRSPVHTVTRDPARPPSQSQLCFLLPQVLSNAVYHGGHQAMNKEGVRVRTPRMLFGRGREGSPVVPDGSRGHCAKRNKPSLDSHLPPLTQAFISSKSRPPRRYGGPAAVLGAGALHTAHRAPPPAQFP